MPRRNTTLGLLAAAAVACAAGPIAGVTPALASPSIVVTPVAAFEAETMVLPASLGRPNADATASGGKNLMIWSNGAAAKALVTSVAANRLSVRVKGTQCSGAATMSVRVDGVQVFHGPVSATFMDVQSSVNVAVGAHKVTVALTNDFRASWCDRNLFVDTATLTNQSVLPWWPVPAPAPTSEG